MQRPLKLILLGLTLAMLSVFALPALAAQDETVMIGPDAVLFREDGGIQIWTPDADGNWNPVISESAADLAALPESPDSVLTVATDGNITLYKLTNGQYQINNGVHEDGKTQVVIFESDFGYSSQYEWSVYAD